MAGVVDSIPFRVGGCDPPPWPLPCSVLVFRSPGIIIKIECANHSQLLRTRGGHNTGSVSSNCGMMGRRLYEEGSVSGA